MVIDFFPETYRYTYDVPNNVYFATYINEARTDVAEFENARLLSFEDRDSEGVEVESGISTIHRGKGVFTFTPERNLIYRLEVTIPQVSRPLEFDLEIDRKFDSDNNEVTFTIEKRILENDENLIVTFYANDRLDEDDFYMIQINHKEQALYSENF